MPGAAQLASRAALLSGSGLVTLASTPKVLSTVLRAAPDLLSLSLTACDGQIRSSAAAKLAAYARLRRASAAGIGPGLGQSATVRGAVRKLVSEMKLPLVLDADGLNAFAGKPGLFRKRSAPLVLTPHRGEFGRLFGQAPPEALAARRRLAKRLAAEYHVVLVLKGHRTLVTDGRREYVNSTGNPGMAKGGTGDVLTGMIAAFLAQGLDPFGAAAWAVHFHGKAGDRLAKKTSELSVTASGLLGELPAVFTARG